MKKHRKGHDHQKWRIEARAARTLVEHLNRHEHPPRYQLGPHREAPDYSLRVLTGIFAWHFVGLEVTHLYASGQAAAKLNGSVPPPDHGLPAPTLDARRARLDGAIADKNAKFAAYTLKPCWLLICNADAGITGAMWRDYLAGRDFSDSPYAKIWLIADGRHLINIK